MALRVHINCAVTLDGCLGGPGRTRLRISSDEDRRRVQELRSRMDAILVGVGTVVADDPSLTVKWDLLGRAGRNPLRVVLDPTLRTPPSARILGNDGTTLFFARRSAPDRPRISVERVRAPRNELDLAEVLDRLESRGIREILVEGGARTFTRFFLQDRVDEATIFVSPKILGEPNAPRLVEGGADLRAHLRLTSASALGDGALLRFERP